MSLRTLHTAAALATLLIGSAPAWAQSDDQADPFFADKVGEAEARGEEPTETLFQGSLTSTTFAYREFGGTPTEVDQGVLTEGYLSNYSPAMRLFTDLRTQLDAKHISGSSWDMRMDARARVSLPCTYKSLDGSDEPYLYNGCRTQAGIYGDNEYEARELYMRRAGLSSDLFIGRQFVHELAATKIDGVKFVYHKSDKWDYLGFGGLYPARGSRSVLTDYPTTVLAGGVQGGRVLPIAAGVGAAYRYRSLYGSLGAVGIVPMAEDRYENANEPPRIFATSSGYWRGSRKLDLYHFLVIDAQGADGPGVTNLSLGLNIRPVPSMRLFAAVNHVDTETLNVIAQTYLEEPDNLANAQPRNDVAVSRISAQSARLGVSTALGHNRFEISTSGQVRQRPDIELVAINGDAILIPAARAAEVTVQAVDRRSLLGLRTGLSLSRIFGIGNQVYSRSTAWVARLDGSRDFSQGKGQVEANVSFVSGEDTNRELPCAAAQYNIENCFGTSLAQTLSLGGTVFYRFKTDWFVIASASVGRQTLANYYNVTLYQQPANFLVSGFGRLAYRF